MRSSNTSRIISPPPLNGGMAASMLVFAVEHADAGRPVELVAGEDVEIAVEVAHVDVEMHRALRAVDQHRNAARVRELHDLLHRHDGAEHVRHVRDRDHLGARRRAASRTRRCRKLPSSSTGAHLITAPWRSRRKCHGTMLEWCSMIESTISSPGLMRSRAERIGDEIDRLGGVAGEDDLFGAAGVEERAHRLARALVGLRSPRWRDSAGRDARWRIPTV